MDTALTASAGPRSAPGKARSARNRLRHGIASVLPVLPGVESEEDWQRHLTGINKSLLPATHLEGILAERIALILWRLRRVARYEREVTLRDHEELQARYTSPVVLIDEAARAREWMLYADHDGRPLSAAALAALVGLLPAIPGDPLLTREASLAVLDAFAQAAGVTDLPALLAGLAGHDDPANCITWTTSMLTEGTDRIARHAGVASHDLKQKVVIAATARVAEAGTEGERRFRRARLASLLPHPEVLEGIIRYEAHLNRQLLAALHELEALQARRVGQPAPLARLDVSGLPVGAET